MLDYKSNALGPRDGDYTAAALQASMAEHRYDVQAALYMLALAGCSRCASATRTTRSCTSAARSYFYLRVRTARPAAAATCRPTAPFLDALDAAFGSER